MLHVAVIDDNLAYAKAVEKKLLADTSVDELIGVDLYQNPMQLLYEIQKGKVYDICFSDVKMPQMNGIELAERVREMDTDVFWVFLSYYPEYAIKGYRVDAYEYLLKEELEEKWENFWKKLRSRIKEERRKMYILEYNNYQDKIYRRNIQFIHKSGKNAVFVLTDREIMIRRNMFDMNNILYVTGNNTKVYKCAKDIEIFNIKEKLSLDFDELLLINHNWNKVLEQNETLFNGNVLSVKCMVNEEDKIKIWLECTNYAHMIYSINSLDEEVTICRSIASGGLLLTNDGYLVLGKMGKSTAFPDIIQCIGGGIEEKDIKCSLGKSLKKG